MCSDARSRPRLGGFACRVIYHTRLGNPPMCLLRTLVEVSAVGWVPSKLSLSLSQSPGRWGAVTQDCRSPSILHSLEIKFTPFTGRLEIEFSSLYFFAGGLGFKASVTVWTVYASCLLQQDGVTLIVSLSHAIHPPHGFNPGPQECVGFLRNESYLPIEVLLSSTQWNITESAYLAFFLTT